MLFVWGVSSTDEIGFEIFCLSVYTLTVGFVGVDTWGVDFRLKYGCLDFRCELELVYLCV